MSGPASHLRKEALTGSAAPACAQRRQATSVDYGWSRRGEDSRYYSPHRTDRERTRTLPKRSAAADHRQIPAILNPGPACLSTSCARAPPRRRVGARRRTARWRRASRGGRYVVVDAKTTSPQLYEQLGFTATPRSASLVRKSANRSRHQKRLTVSMFAI